MKQKVGFFDFTGCEGCQLTVLTLEDQLPELIELVDIAEFREVMESSPGPLDIAFVEGSITTEAQAKRLREIRSRSGILVALGACAVNGGVNALAGERGVERLRRDVYGSFPPALETTLPRPLDTVVAVDHQIPGCPIDGREFLSVLQALLIGRPPLLPSYALCVECKLAELPCTFEREEICLGPVVRAGCNALCIQRGDRCRGCRGQIDNPRSDAYRRILTEHGLSTEDILREFRTFNVPQRGES